MIDTHSIPELVKRGDCHRSVRVARTPCVTEQNIEPSQTGGSLTDGLLDRLWLCYITQLECRIATRSDNTACYSFTVGHSATRQHDASSFPSKHFGASLANSTRCAHH
jgi:hypothetical protein